MSDMTGKPTADLRAIHARWHAHYDQPAASPSEAAYAAHHQVTAALVKAGEDHGCELPVLVEMYRSRVAVKQAMTTADLPLSVIAALREAAAQGYTMVEVIGMLTVNGYELRVAPLGEEDAAPVAEAAGLVNPEPEMPDPAEPDDMGKARSFDAENRMIARNKRRKIAKEEHDYVPARWATRDGRKRCVLCGSVAPDTGKCLGLTATRMSKTIREEGGQFCVYSADGTRSFGCYGSRGEAEARLRQVEFFGKAEGVKVGDFVRWNSSGGPAQGRVEHVMTEGVLGVPDSDFSINAEPGDPAVLIRVWRQTPEGWAETETLVGHKASTLRRIEPLSKAETYTPPAGVREAAQRALDWIAEGKAGDGFTAVGRKRASDLAAGRPVSTDTITRMNSYFARHEVDRDAEGFKAGEDGYPSPGRVAWDAWGGDPGRSWAAGIMRGMTKAEACPVATHDIKVNLRNREKAIKTAAYGPLNPAEPNTEFWRAKGDRWGVSIAEAKKSLCGNCAAFNKTSRMLDCIATGLESGGSGETDAWATVEAGDLGYCEAFDFKCASGRTCDAWIAGGPVTDAADKSDPGVGAVHVDTIMGGGRRGRLPEGALISDPPRRLPADNTGATMTAAEDEEPEMDAEDAMTPRQSAMYHAYEMIADLAGVWDLSDGPEGAHYIPAADNVFAARGIACANCAFWMGDGMCEIVEGEVEPGGACKLWIIPEPLMSAEPVTEAIGPHSYGKADDGDGCSVCGQAEANWRHSVNKAAVIQKEDARRFTLGPMYVPDFVDAHGEWTDADSLQQAVWEYVKAGDRRIRLQHNRDVVAGEWVECMAWPYPVTVPMMDPSTGKESTVTYPANTVFLGVQWEPWAWELVKAGKLRGYSIGGRAERILADLPTEEETAA